VETGEPLDVSFKGLQDVAEMDVFTEKPGLPRSPTINWNIYLEI
jgi:hypothetical protein